MKNSLEVDGIILEFGRKRILQDVYLKCDRGEVVGVLGRNGTGKSSLFKIISGDLIASSQFVRIDGKTCIGSKRSSEDIKYLPQYNFVPTHLTIKRLLKDFDVNWPDLTDNFPAFEKYYNSKLIDLSTGQRRIIELFVVLVSQSKFCILDEPFSQVMPIHVEIIKKLILREKLNKGIILSDHMYRHILDLSDKLYVINGGKAYLTKSIDDLETLGYLSLKK